MSVVMPATRNRRTVLGAVGLTYLAAWVVGLLIWPANLATDASGATVISTFTGHLGVALAQYLLTEGLAGITVGIVLVAIARALHGALATTALLSGVLAALVSLVETGIGGYLAHWLVPARDADAVHTWFTLLNTLDGAKMFLFAITAAAVSAAAAQRALPRWLDWVGVALAVAMIVSGTGYVFDLPTVALAAAASLPLLLVWVTGASVSLRSAPESRG